MYVERVLYSAHYRRHVQTIDALDASPFAYRINSIVVHPHFFLGLSQCGQNNVSIIGLFLPSPGEANLTRMALEILRPLGQKDVGSFLSTFGVGVEQRPLAGRLVQRLGERGRPVEAQRSAGVQCGVPLGMIAQ